MASMGLNAMRKRQRRAHQVGPWRSGAWALVIHICVTGFIPQLVLGWIWKSNHRETRVLKLKKTQFPHLEQESPGTLFKCSLCPLEIEVGSRICLPPYHYQVSPLPATLGTCSPAA